MVWMNEGHGLIWWKHCVYWCMLQDRCWCVCVCVCVYTTGCACEVVRGGGGGVGGGGGGGYLPSYYVICLRTSKSISVVYSGTWVNGHLYKPNFWSIPVSKESPKWSQYITGSLHKQVTQCITVRKYCPKGDLYIQVSLYSSLHGSQ